MTTLIDAIDRVKLQLNDPEASRWTVSELAEYALEALEDMARLRPELFVLRSTVSLVAGAEQTLPTGAVRLTNLWSVNTGGTITYPRKTTRTALSLFDPSWTVASAGPPTDYALGDTQNTFWLYPPQPATAGTADVEYIYVQQTIQPGSELPVPEDFVPAVVDYMLYRAFGKDSIAGQSEQADAALASYASRMAQPEQVNGEPK